MRPDGTPDHALWHALQTTYSLDDALNLREIAEVGQSWQHATARNDAAIAEIRDSRRKRE